MVNSIKFEWVTEICGGARPYCHIGAETWDVEQQNYD